jgi:hypothetical protein
METKAYTWRTRQELEVCEDCIYMSYNGEPNYEGYAISGHSLRYAHAVREYGDEPNTGDVANTQQEPSFSHHACDFCGDSLSGSRYTASIMQLHTESGE